MSDRRMVYFSEDAYAFAVRAVSQLWTAEQPATRENDSWPYRVGERTLKELLDAVPEPTQEGDGAQTWRRLPVADVDAVLEFVWARQRERAEAIKTRVDEKQTPPPGMVWSILHQAFIPIEQERDEALATKLSGVGS